MLLCFIFFMSLYFLSSTFKVCCKYLFAAVHRALYSATISVFDSEIIKDLHLNNQNKANKMECNSAHWFGYDLRTIRIFGLIHLVKLIKNIKKIQWQNVYRYFGWYARSDVKENQVILSKIDAPNAYHRM